MGLLIILVFVSVAVYQIQKLAKARMRKELVWFCLLWTTGFVLCMLLNAGVKITGPIKIVMDMLDKIGLHY